MSIGWTLGIALLSPACSSSHTPPDATILDAAVQDAPADARFFRCQLFPPDGECEAIQGRGYHLDGDCFRAAPVDIFCLEEGAIAHTAESCLHHLPTGYTYGTAYGYPIGGCDDWSLCTDEQIAQRRSASSSRICDSEP